MNKSPWILMAVLSGLLVLSACGGGHGLVGGGQNGGITLQSISMSPKNPTLTLTVAPASPATQQFVVIGTYNVGNPQDITKQMSWTSLDTTVVTVDKNGLASAVGSGRAYVMAQIQDPITTKVFQSSTILTVVPQLTAITINPASAQIAHGTTQQFIATGNFNDKSSADITSQVTWISSQPGAATVSTSPGTQGLATGVSAGSTSISAFLGALNTSPAALTVTSANLLSISLNPSAPSVPLASSQQLAATGTFDDGTTQDISGDVTWTSSNADVARVSGAGVVSGRGLGTATITASSGSISKTAQVTVDASSVSTVNVIPVETIATGTQQQMRAVAAFRDGSSLEVTKTPGIAWSSSNTTVAIVEASNGLATGAGPGSATITATLGNKSGSTSLTASSVSIQSLAVAPSGATIAQGGVQNFIALGTFSDGTNSFQQDISSVAAWSSQDPGVAQVAYVNGLQELAQGVSSGTTQINASFSAPGGGTASASAPLAVGPAQLSSISLQPGSASFPLGGGQQFLATGNFSDGTQVDLTSIADWGSLNPKIATAGPFGYASASGSGQTSISATFGAQSGAAPVLINPAALLKIDICATMSDPVSNCPPLDPVPPPPPISFAEQAPFGLVAIGTYSDGSRADLTSAVHWSSSSPSVATISNEPGIPEFATGVTRQGVVTGLQGGTATIKATIGGVSGSVEVIVTDAQLVFLTVTPANATISLGTMQQCAVVGTFTDNTTRDLTAYVHWFTSDPGVAVVIPGGLAYSSGIGTATVMATMNGAAGSTTLTVQ